MPTMCVHRVPDVNDFNQHSSSSSLPSYHVMDIASLVESLLQQFSSNNPYQLSVSIKFKISNISSFTVAHSKSAQHKSAETTQLDPIKFCPHQLSHNTNEPLLQDHHFIKQKNYSILQF